MLSGSYDSWMARCRSASLLIVCPSARLIDHLENTPGFANRSVLDPNPKPKHTPNTGSNHGSNSNLEPGLNPNPNPNPTPTANCNPTVPLTLTLTPREHT